MSLDQIFMCTRDSLEKDKGKDEENMGEDQWELGVKSVSNWICDIFSAEHIVTVVNNSHFPEIFMKSEPFDLTFFTYIISPHKTVNLWAFMSLWLQKAGDECDIMHMWTICWKNLTLQIKYDNAATEMKHTFKI